MAIGLQIAKARRLRGLTQSALADLLGVSQGLISHWERGRSEPSRAEVKRMASALSLPHSEMEGLAHNTNESPSFFILQPEAPLLPTARPIPIVGTISKIWGSRVEKIVQGWLPVHLPKFKKAGLQAFRVIGDHLAPRFPDLTILVVTPDRARRGQAGDLILLELRRDDQSRLILATRTAEGLTLFEAEDSTAETSRQLGRVIAWFGVAAT